LVARAATVILVKDLRLRLPLSAASGTLTKKGRFWPEIPDRGETNES
jgi:hypothetical protein